MVTVPESRRHLDLRLVAGVLLAAGAAIWLWSYLSRERPGAKILPDTTGRITHVACIVNSARRATLRNAAVFSHIVNALDPQTKVLLLINDRAAFTVQTDPHPGRVRFLELPSDADLTIWPQDPFVVLREPTGRTVLLASHKYQRADDRLAAPAVAETMGWTVRPSSLAFEGGNIVTGDRWVFVGANTVRYNAIRLGESDHRIAERFEQELGRPILVVGPVPQPIAHVDMFLTPLDGGRVALADPAWGARLADQQLAGSGDAVAAFERECERMFFGHPVIRTVPGPGGSVMRPPKIVGRTRQAAVDSRAIAPQLDKLAETLEQHGLEVIRIPFLFVRTGPGAVTRPASQPTTKPDTKRTAHYPELTYNNVLLETSDRGRIVYLPQYGWPALDDAAAAAWRRAGYTVTPVNGLTISAMYGGSLRCCVKVLTRAAP